METSTPSAVAQVTAETRELLSDYRPLQVQLHGNLKESYRRSSDPATAMLRGMSNGKKSALTVPQIAMALADAGLDGVLLSDLETAAMFNALRHCGGNRTYAARSLGISVRTLQRNLKALAANTLHSNLLSADRQTNGII